MYGHVERIHSYYLITSGFITVHGYRLNLSRCQILGVGEFVDESLCSTRVHIIYVTDAPMITDELHINNRCAKL